MTSGPGHIHKELEIRSRSSGFSKIELVVTLAVLAICAMIFAAFMHGRKDLVETAQCRQNLATIGRAYALYANQNWGEIPYAGIRPRAGFHVSWDDLLNKNLGGNLDWDEICSAHPTNAMPMLLCPSDHVPVKEKEGQSGAIRRTYSMPQHDMLDENWPPGPENKTGLGLYWGAETSRKIPKIRRPRTGAGAHPLERPSNPECFTIDMVLKPASTIELTERLNPGNIIGSVPTCTIPDTSRHLEYPGLRAMDFHKGKINYLFLDGHVDGLEPVKTLGVNSPHPIPTSGMWTVNAND